MENGKKQVAIITVCSLLLVAMVVALIIAGQSSTDSNEDIDVAGSQKAITAICQTTDYQDTCMNSLQGHNSSNPKELIEASFQAAIDNIKEALKNSTTLKQLQTNPRAKAALDTCDELANRAIDDLHRSFSKFSQFDVTNVDDVLLDLKIWLSGALTHQETCLDGFDNEMGDAGTKMRVLLTTSMQMTSNALAMVTEISTFLESMGIQGFQSRRLLSEELPLVLGHGDDLPGWLDYDRRFLVSIRPQKIKPDVVVAKDGSGKFRTINGALKALPENSNKTIVLYIKEGVYKEHVKINSTLKRLMMIGDGPTKTRITGDLNFIDGTGTYHTATVAVHGDEFVARDIGFENSAGAEKHQAVALRVSADKTIFYNCHMDGYQDTLYAHTYRQFYRDCTISGTIDFIFGDSAAIFQGCTLLVRKPLSNQQNIVTAQGRKDLRQPTGLVLQNCTFKADDQLYPVRTQVKSYLARPWKEYSRTIIMESFIDDFIHPDGYLPWNATFALDTLFYTEFNNRGPASPKAKRVKWPGVKELPPKRIQRFTAAAFIDANRWVPSTRVPYAASFIFPVPKEDPNIKYSPVVPEENKDLGSNDKSAYAPRTISPPAQTTPAAPPPTATVVPSSDIATPPTTALPPQGQTTAASPQGQQAAGVGPNPTIPVPITNPGDVIIDLSPSPATIPTFESAQAPLSGSAFSPQPEGVVAPTLSSSGSSASSPQSDVTAAAPTLPPIGNSASAPQPDVAITAASPLSPSGSSTLSPQSEATASPTTAASGPSASTPQPGIAAAPHSLNPLAGAPSLSFAA